MKTMINLKNIRSDEELKVVLKLSGASPREFQNRLFLKLHDVMKTKEKVENLENQISETHLAEMSMVIENEIDFLEGLIRKIDGFIQEQRPVLSFGSISQIQQYLSGFDQATEE